MFKKLGLSIGSLALAIGLSSFGSPAHAQGGAHSYLTDSVLKNGFALVAWPAEYGKTGVMSFIVNQDGQVYQKDLGPRTASAVDAIRSFDPDTSWHLAQP